MAEARALLSGAQADARILAAGDHETLLTTTFDERRIHALGRFLRYRQRELRTD